MNSSVRRQASSEAARSACSTAAPASGPIGGIESRWWQTRWLPARDMLALGVAKPPRNPPTLRGELSLEGADLVAPAPDELELAVDVADRLGEDLAPAGGVVHSLAPFAPQRRPRALDARQLAELLERHAEQILEAQELAEALDVIALVEAVRAGLAAARAGQEADLLVVADRPRRRSGRLRRLADAHEPLLAWHPSALLGGDRRRRGCAGMARAQQRDA